ncbi:hypothetical protein [Gracilinema caldarium]|uniref:hypothetical protein n=1 Tax=Gracilinema caldarium TaxID=215591 RepID=UPI0026EA7B35|nr:hypothetical protein [Gracilinema caldarium]
MKSFIRLHPYVRELEERVARLEKEAERREAAIDSMARYIDQLETLKSYLEQQIADLKRGYRP